MALDLGKQVGPMPLGAWVVVVGGGLGIALYSRKAGSNKQVAIVEDTGSPPGVGVGGTFVQIQQPPQISAPTPATNEEWARACINWLIAEGYDAGQSDIAMRKYLEAGSLSPQEFSLVKLALGKFGSPPVPLPSPQPPSSVPSAPVDLIAPPQLVILEKGGSSITISWNPVPGALYYQVREWSSLGQSHTISFSTVFHKAHLASNTVHNFEVRAVAGPGQIGPPSTVSGSTGAPYKLFP